MGLNKTFRISYQDGITEAIGVGPTREAALTDGIEKIRLLNPDFSDSVESYFIKDFLDVVEVN